MPNIYHNIIKIYGEKKDLSLFKVWFNDESIDFLTSYEDIP